MKEAHKKAIEAATEAGAIINFDPNLRFALWEHVTVYYSSSVSLGDFPMKEAHKKAIEAATEAGAIINFDPNLRFALWEHVTVYYSSIE